MNNFSKLFNTEKTKLKHMLLDPIKSAGFSAYEAKKFGFNFSTKLWKSDLKKKRNLGGRPKIKVYFKKALQSFFEENSTLAPNRFLKLQNNNVRYRNKTLKDSFNSIKDSFSDFISFSSFYKYLPKYIKQPYRLTDLCSYCQLNKVSN